LVFLLGLSLALGPFLMRNVRIAGEASLTPSQAGFNLYLGNNPDNRTPYYQPVPFAYSGPSVQGIHFTIEASRRSGRPLSPSRASRYWTREVFRIAKEQPAVFARKTGQKLLALFNRFEFGDHYHSGFISQFVHVFKLPLLEFGLILPLAMAGMVVGLFRSKKISALAIIFFLYGMALVPFFISGRYRLPLAAVLIPCASAGIKDLTIFVGNRQTGRIAVYLLTLLVFFAVGFLPLKGTGDISYHYNTYAQILFANGRDEQARLYWEKSSRMNTLSSASANYSLAVLHFKKGEIAQGFQTLRKIPDTHFAAASKYELIGDVMANQRNVVEAVRAYEKALAINSGLRNIHVKLSHMLWNIDRQRALEEFEKFKALSLYYNVL